MHLKLKEEGGEEEGGGGEIGNEGEERQVEVARNHV